jgi:hypothetical protein
MQILKLGDKADIQHLYNLDKRLKSIADIRIEKRDLYPTNLDEEYQKFLKALDKGERYNPQFKYDSIDYSKTNVLSMIDSLSREFTKFGHEFSQYYLNILDFYRRWVVTFEKDPKRSSREFADSLFQLYGKTDYRALTLAKDLLKTNKYVAVSEEEKKFGFDYLVEKFEEKMNSLGIQPWKCQSKNIPGRIGLSTPERKIYINEKAKFAEGDINSLLAHEIGVHVYRAQTGYDLGLFAFTIGSVTNEAIEEGLAIRRSYSLDITKPNILFEASINCLISSVVDTMDFFSLFEYLEKYNPDVEWRFRKVCRVKRCLEDTSIFGGFTRDQVYMKGYSIVKDLDDKTYNTDLFKYRLANTELMYIPTLDKIKSNKKYLDV